MYETCAGVSKLCSSLWFLWGAMPEEAGCPLLYRGSIGGLGSPRGLWGAGTQACVLTLEPDSLAASVMTSGAKSAVSRVVPPGLIPGPWKKLCLLAGSVATSPDEGSAWEFDFLIRFEAILNSSRQHRPSQQGGKLIFLQGRGGSTGGWA